MHWIIFGVMLILAQSPARRKCPPLQQQHHLQQQHYHRHHHHQNYPAATDAQPSATRYDRHPHPQPLSTVAECTGGARRGWMVEAVPVPLNLDRPPISPYIRHWEPAAFDRAAIARDRGTHDQQRQQRRRRKRAARAGDDQHSIGSIDGVDRTTDADGGGRREEPAAPYLDAEIGVGNELRFSFYAHDRQFNVVLREDPTSVFAPDIEIENTSGPVHYDLTRVYSGTLEDDPDAIVHGILTADHLFDGTITTAHEQYYVEPAARYAAVAGPTLSAAAAATGVHSIVYKVSDVRHPSSLPLPSHHLHHRHHTKDDDDAANADDNDANDAARASPTAKDTYDVSDGVDGDADNDGDGVGDVAAGGGGASFCASERLRRKMQMDFKRRRKLTASASPKDGDDADEDTDRHRRTRRWLPEEISENRNPPLPLDLDVPYNDDFSVYRDSGHQHPNVAQAGVHRPGTGPPPLRKILINDYNPNSDFNLRLNHTTRNIITSTFDQPSQSNASSSSRPSHKTHVEIITKHGATKKPNIIGNNYHPPDVVQVTSTVAGGGGGPHHPHVGAHTGRTAHSTDGGSDGPHTSARAENRKVTCMLYLQADHTFFGKMGSEEASIEAITRHVQRANVIYKGTDFNGDGKPDNITFMIKRIKVHTNNALKDPLYRFPGNYGVEKFLELFSEEDYDAFCLAYMFTYRDFEMGTLGLAWTGDLKNAGGVCEKNGHYRGSLKSLNTGIVTLLNYGKHVPPAVSHVTLAHEIGHNFGSPHDPEQCTPGGEDGNFIMFARATSGDKRNNNRFSPCSLKAIEPVLNTKARSHKGCFTEPQVAICGNGVVDPGEQCDCGWEDDCKDACCFPMSRHPDPSQRPCTLTPQAACSPSQGPCCTDACRLRLGDKCRNDNGCRDESFCDGRRPQCPPSINKANKTICNKEFVCYMGECTGSICLAYGLESCQCVARPSDPATKPCELCCKGLDGVCKSSFEWNDVPYDVPDMFAKPGTPCNEYNGYCDVFQKCRDVDPSGPLATLRKILLSEENFERFRVWCAEHWWQLLLVLAVLLAMMVATCWLLDCGYSATKQKRRMKKKTVTIIHSATTETVRLPDDNNGVIVHTAVRSKVPFRKKVRGERSSKSAAAKTAHGDPAAFKRHHQQSSTAAAAAVSKKKQRLSAPVGDELTAADVAVHIEPTSPAVAAQPVAASKSKSKSKSSSKSSKHKEVIDYSSKQHSQNTFGKVHKWLLESEPAAGGGGSSTTTATVAAAQIPSATAAVDAAPTAGRHAVLLMNKSQSTPEHLTGGGGGGGGAKRPGANPATTNGGTGAAANDKVKLQVVYKPPFKFSLKFSKNSAVKTKVIGGGVGRSKAKQTTANGAAAAGGAHRAHRAAEPSTRRTALLVQTVKSAAAEDSTAAGAPFAEPTYETLTPKRAETSTAAAKTTPAPLYENLHLSTDASAAPANAPLSAPINTATFRISKSASGSNLMRGSAAPKAQQHSRQSRRRAAAAASTSQTDLLHDAGSGDTPFGSSQNLIRSSTSNLSKQQQQQQQQQQLQLSRSSTTNLSSKQHQHRPRSSSRHRTGGRGSNPNLYAFENEVAGGGTGGSAGSRRNSLARAQHNNGEGVTPMQRTSSHSNLRRDAASSSGANIPRANLSVRQPQQSRASSKRSADRPHTADCTDGAAVSGRPHSVHGFEWPPALRSSSSMVATATNGGGGDGDNPLPSDLEVMVSDVENLVTDM